MRRIEVPLGLGGYVIEVHRESARLWAEWTCNRCLHWDRTADASSIDKCEQQARAAVDEHHDENHSNETIDDKF